VTRPLPEPAPPAIVMTNDPLMKRAATVRLTVMVTLQPPVPVQALDQLLKA
jgi:hypothetical protein